MTTARRVAVVVASLLTLIAITGLAATLVLLWIAAAPHHDTEAERGFLCFLVACGFGVAAFFAWLISLDVDVLYADADERSGQ